LSGLENQVLSSSLGIERDVLINIRALSNGSLYE